jgi:hypothetical protein
MQVETDDFIYSLTAGDADGNEQTEIITTHHSGIPADLVHTDVSDIVSILQLNSFKNQFKKLSHITT